MSPFEFETAFGLLAGLLVFCSYLFYIISIIRGTTKPNRASWLMLTTISVVIAVAYAHLGAVETLYAALGAAGGTGIVALLSLWYSRGSGWSHVDLLCIALACACLGVYFASTNSSVTFFASLLMDAVAMFPTIRHAKLAPQEEDGLAWTMTVAGDVCAILAIDTWAFSIAAYPLYMFAINGLVLALILWKVPLAHFIAPYLAKRHEP